MASCFPFSFLVSKIPTVLASLTYHVEGLAKWYGRLIGLDGWTKRSCTLSNEDMDLPLLPHIHSQVPSRNVKAVCSLDKKTILRAIQVSAESLEGICTTKRRKGLTSNPINVALPFPSLHKHSKGFSFQVYQSYPTPDKAKVVDLKGARMTWGNVGSGRVGWGLASILTEVWY